MIFIVNRTKTLFRTLENGKFTHKITYQNCSALQPGACFVEQVLPDNLRQRLLSCTLPFVQ
uniref:Uncharacterized protein n=1 Tax=Arundo donax TaxID=35708 RepID=A0A0A9HD97_ARUDO